MYGARLIYLSVHNNKMKEIIKAIVIILLIVFLVRQGISSSGSLTVKAQLDGDLGLSSSSSGSVTSSSSSSSSGLLSTSSSSSGGSSSGGTSSSSGGISSSSSGSGLVILVEPELNIFGPDKLVLRPKKSNAMKLIVSGINFKSATKCQILVSSDSIIRIKPRELVLNKINEQKVIRISVPPLVVHDLISNNTSKTVTINVSCNNGVTDDFDLTISPP